MADCLDHRTQILKIARSWIKASWLRGVKTQIRKPTQEPNESTKMRGPTKSHQGRTSEYEEGGRRRSETAPPPETKNSTKVGNGTTRPGGTVSLTRRGLRGRGVLHDGEMLRRVSLPGRGGGGEVVVVANLWERGASRRWGEEEERDCERDTVECNGERTFLLLLQARAFFCGLQGDSGVRRQDSGRVSAASE